MIQTKRLRLSIALLPLLAATPALAQEQQREPTVFDGDWLTIGAGAVVGPSYEGSDDYAIFPIPAVTGRVGGIGIAPRGAGLALDFIKDPSDAKISFQAGPEVRLRFDRNRQIRDEVVKLLGKRDVAVEVGGNVGFSINRVTNPYDSLTLSVDVRHDVAGAHKSTIITPNLSFMTPLSKGMFVALNVSADHVEDRFARYYYSVTPADSVASGLPTFDAKGGWKNVSVGMIGSLDLDGDLTNGGFALFAAGNYSRLLGDFKDAPIVSVRGSPNQFMGAIGIGYTF